MPHQRFLTRQTECPRLRAGEKAAARGTGPVWRISNYPHLEHVASASVRLFERITLIPLEMILRRMIRG